MIWNIILGLALLIIGYLIMPKQKQKTEISELEAPTADAGKPWPVMFGEVTIKSGNYLWWGDKGNAQRSVRTGKK